MNFSEILRDLSDSSLCIWPGYFGPEQIGKMKSDFDQLLASDQFKAAQVGKISSLDSQVRDGDICWITRDDPKLVAIKLWNWLDELKLNLNQSLFLGINGFEGHYAQYPEKGFYQRHLDAFSSDQKRKVSIIIYLNREWAPGDGGELRVYQNGSHIDIEPRAGTLVCFLSHELEHEVLPSLRIRESFSGWFLS